MGGNGVDTLPLKRGKGTRGAVACGGAGTAMGRSGGSATMLEDSGASGGAGKDPVLILGAGWVGSRLAKALEDEGTPVLGTHRPTTAVDAKPPYFRPVPLEEESQLAFELTDPDTWSNLPAPESLGGVVITFALSSAPTEFWESYLSKVRNIVCYSSTSVYEIDVPGQLVDETTPVKSAGRAAAEAYVLERGATVLTISGIFGERRSPRGICTCLSTYTSAGGVLNGNKRVNMVHVDDIIAASRTCLEKPRPRERINVAGHHFLLSELITHCKHPGVPDGPDTDLSSKCVCSQKLLEEVMPEGFDFVQPLSRAAPVASS